MLFYLICLLRVCEIVCLRSRSLGVAWLGLAWLGLLGLRGCLADSLIGVLILWMAVVVAG